ncbi:hypothetical protein [Tepidibacter mesophilus]|uniref:hypothetical protein n=1 Tax=Tepidibacter mesophilus TaxID=655607 RepID=UPI000C067E81|nr:hypothetical protein [Tepidibacter mesophilus]
MSKEIDAIKLELKSLCQEFTDVLNKMKDQNIISEEEYNEYSSKKIEFLEN